MRVLMVVALALMFVAAASAPLNLRKLRQDENQVETDSAAADLDGDEVVAGADEAMTKVETAGAETDEGTTTTAVGGKASNTKDANTTTTNTTTANTTASMNSATASMNSAGSTMTAALLLVTPLLVVMGMF